MELRQLRYFTTIVEEGTVTGAAHRLNMTQPPLTAQLHNLEDELGCRLFDHKGRRLHLTEAGRALYERACTILGLCDTTAAEINDFATGAAGTLRIGVVSSVQETMFPKWLCRFALDYPRIQYEVYSANTYQLIEQLHVGALDLAIIRTPFFAQGLEIDYIKKEALVAVGIADFFEDIPGETITLKQLSRKPLILYRRWEGILRARFESIACSPLVRCCNDTAQTTLLLAQNGLGVGLLPASALPSGSAPTGTADLPSGSALTGTANLLSGSALAGTMNLSSGSALTDAVNLQVRRCDDPSLSTEIAIACRPGQHLTQAAQLFRKFIITHSSLPTLQALPPGLSS